MMAIRTLCRGRKWICLMHEWFSCTLMVRSHTLMGEKTEVQPRYNTTVHCHQKNNPALLLQMALASVNGCADVGSCPCTRSHPWPRREWNVAQPCQQYPTVQLVLSRWSNSSSQPSRGCVANLSASVPPLFCFSSTSSLLQFPWALIARVFT